MKTKIFIILLILSMCLTLLSGCYDSRGIEDLAYATAMGLDISENKSLKLTLQFSIPSSSSDSGSSQSSKTDSISVDCSSISSGIGLINSYISKEVNLSHCKVIVMSEELAANGISEYLDTLANNIEVRPDCNVIISRCPAKEFIKNASPSIETLTARYYEVALNSSEYTGYTTSTKLTDFLSAVKSTYMQGSAILGGVNTGNSSDSQSNGGSSQNDSSSGSSKDSSGDSSDDSSSGASSNGASSGNTSNSADSSNGTSSDSSSGEIDTGSDSQSKADETPIDDSSGVETFGTAVFHGDKLVGELTGMETICFLLVTDELKTCTISIPDPFTQNSTIDLRINKKKNAKINLDFVNGTPYISIEVFLEGFGLSLDEETNYASLENIKVINEYTENYIKVQLENFLYKTSKEFNSDISGFGKYALSKYLTWDEWINSCWLENYKDAFFDVKVNMYVTSGYEFNKSP